MSGIFSLQDFFFHDHEKTKRRKNMFDYIDFLRYLNTHSPNDTYYKIILYILNNSKVAQSLNITEFADACFVSPATISRFSKKFNLSSFAELKKMIHGFNQLPTSKGMRMSADDKNLLNKDTEAYLKAYVNEIHESLNDVLSSLNMQQILNLAEKINHSESVILVGHNATFELAKNIQSLLFISKKVTIVPETNEHIDELIALSKENTLIIVFSSYGTIFNRNLDLITKITESNAYSVLITQSTQNIYTNFFDQSINTTKKIYLKIGTYPLTLYSDFLVRYYSLLYSD